MAPSVSAYVPASSSRRPRVQRRAHSTQGATSVSVIAGASVLTGSDRGHGWGFHGDVDAEVGADLVAQHAADAVLLVRGVHGEPPDLVRGLPVREDVDGADVEAEAARLAHVLADDDVPAAGRPPGGLL